jgi:hypothetical protein
VSIKAPAALASIGRIALDRMLAIIPSRQDLENSASIGSVHIVSELLVPTYGRR